MSLSWHDANVVPRHRRQCAKCLDVGHIPVFAKVLHAPSQIVWQRLCPTAPANLLLSLSMPWWGRVRPRLPCSRQYGSRDSCRCTLSQPSSRTDTSSAGKRCPRCCSIFRRANQDLNEVHGTLQRPHTARSKPITTSRDFYHNFESWGGDSNGSLEPWVPKRLLGHCGQSQHSTTFDNWALLASIVATRQSLNDVNPVACLAETLRRHHQRPSAEPDRGTHALAIPGKRQAQIRRRSARRLRRNALPESFFRAPLTK